MTDSRNPTIEAKLLEGTVFLKIGQLLKRKRCVWASPDFSTLYWAPVGIKNTNNPQVCKAVGLRGARPIIPKRIGHRDRTMCLNFVTRFVLLEAASTAERDEWVSYFTYWHTTFPYARSGPALSLADAAPTEVCKVNESSQSLELPDDAAAEGDAASVSSRDESLFAGSQLFERSEDQLFEIFRQLLLGVSVTKHNRTNTEVVVVWWSIALDTIHWAPASEIPIGSLPPLQSRKVVPLKDIVRIRTDNTQGSYLYRDAHDMPPADCCLSIDATSRANSFDLQTASARTRDWLLEAVLLTGQLLTDTSGIHERFAYWWCLTQPDSMPVGGAHGSGAAVAAAADEQTEVGIGSKLDAIRRTIRRKIL